MGKRHIFVLLVILAGTLAKEDDKENSTIPEILVDADEDGKTTELVLSNFDESSGVPLSEAPETNEEWDKALLEDPQAAPGGITRLVIENIAYNWTIINYSHNNLKHKEGLFSIPFSGEKSQDYRWQLGIYPKGFEDLAKNSVAMYLTLLGDKGVTATVKVSIVNKSGNKVNSLSFKHKHEPYKGHGWKSFITQDNLEKLKSTYLPEDRLTLAIEIMFKPRTKQISGHCEDPNLPECAKMPYNNNFHRDLYLLVGNKTKNETIPVHEAALAAHSTYVSKTLSSLFSTHPVIFKIPMPEGVDDVDDVKEAVRFVYMGEIKPDKSEKLSALADKLGMKKLKDHAESILCNNLAPTKPVASPGDRAYVEVN